MNAALDNSLRDAAVATFEQVVFVLPDTPPDEQQRTRRVSAVASIMFSGPADGILEVRACEGLLPRLTANMMGEDDVSETLQLDALGEIANIICGQMFPHLSPRSAFEQQPPNVMVCTDRGVQARQQPVAHIQLGLEGSRADVLLYLFGDLL
jgi:hypothetical protein